MEFVARTPAGDAVVRLSDDDLISLHACIREALEALPGGAEFRIRVGVETAEVIELMEQVRQVRAALAASIRDDPPSSTVGI